MELVTDVRDWRVPDARPHDGIAFPGPVQISTLSQELQAFADRLAGACRDKADGRRAYSVRVDGHVYRVQARNPIDGLRYVLRLQPSTVPELRDLGIPAPIMKLFLDEYLVRMGGLIIISGATGQGKSTTCAGVIVERLRRFGGICITLEDPPEKPLNGWHGIGYCEQTEVPDGHFSGLIREALRSYPEGLGHMLLVGEVRDKESAAELIRVAINGHLVLTTIHATDLVETLQRVLNMVLESGIGESEARALLASSLRIVANQQLHNGRLVVRLLVCPTPDSGVAARIRNGSDLQLLSTEIQRQHTLLTQGRLVQFGVSQ